VLTTDLGDPNWRKSSFSGPPNQNCVEVAWVGNLVAVRDSKDPRGPALTFTQMEWEAFVLGVLAREFDPPG
jgi:hypothetical protein